MKTQTKLALQISGLGLLSLLGYQNCAPGALNSKTSASTSSSSFADCGEGVCEALDEKPIKVVDSQNALQTMAAKAGVAPSAASMNQFNLQKTKFPETGAVNQVTAPMWMAVSTLGSEVCSDLLTSEMAPTTTRRIFNSVDFTKGPDVLNASPTAVNDVIRRMARSFWSRNETAQEATLIRMSLSDAFSGTTAGDTRKQMLYLCVAMMSSVDAQKY